MVMAALQRNHPQAESKKRLAGTLQLNWMDRGATLYRWPMEALLCEEDCRHLLVGGSNCIAVALSMR
jgi:hypothetical protein